MTPAEVADLLMGIARSVERIGYDRDVAPPAKHDHYVYDKGWRDSRAEAALYIAARAKQIAADGRCSDGPRE